MERFCKTCRHFRTVPTRDPKTGEILTLGYCKATSNHAYRTEDCTCKRWNYIPEMALKS